LRGPGQVTPVDAALVAAAATAANLFESVLGAAVQGRVAWLSNDVVNALQISVAAALAICGHLLALGVGLHRGPSVRAWTPRPAITVRNACIAPGYQPRLGYSSAEDAPHRETLGQLQQAINRPAA